MSQERAAASTSDLAALTSLLLVPAQVKEIQTSLEEIAYLLRIPQVRALPLQLCVSFFGHSQEIQAATSTSLLT
jgi:hypothetical protein